MKHSGRQMDAFDRRLAGAVQLCVPLVREPYQQLAAELGTDGQSILQRLAFLRHAGVVREISGVFDAGAPALGYAKALIAFRVQPDKLDKAGEVAAGHPGVSHCYGRTNKYNLWFTLATSPKSVLGLAQTTEILVEKCGAVACMILPMLRQYKLDTQRLGRLTEGTTRRPDEVKTADEPRGIWDQTAAKSPRPSPEQLAAIRALQADLPNRDDPFGPPAEQAGMKADMLLVHAADFLAAGWMRRYSALIQHRAIGIEANVLVAWQVAPGVADVAGAKCASFSAVSHCYLRPPAEDWPYSLYTMIHGRSRQDCAMTIKEIETTANLRQHVELQTQREYKKKRIALFSDEEALWEKRNTA